MRKKHQFAKANQLEALITQYFESIETDPPAKPKAVKQQPDPPTIAGLSLHLGFNSKQEFEDYELNGKFAARLKRARLRIEALYEKKLHTQYTSGAIFALKSMGWNERADNKSADENTNIILKIEIIHSGPQLAASEKEVVL